MSNQGHFEVVCPNNHNQTVEYSQTEFEAVRSSGSLVFHCNTCDTDWSPSGKEIADIERQFRKESS